MLTEECSYVGKAKDGSDSRFDRGTWKVMQVTMNDTSKFVDMLHQRSVGRRTTERRRAR